MIGAGTTNQVEFPGMQRANHDCAINYAIRQRSVTVGASVLGRKKPLPQVKYGDLAARHFHASSFA
jgi:hypothetical protein